MGFFIGFCMVGGDVLSRVVSFCRNHHVKHAYVGKSLTSDREVLELVASPGHEDSVHDAFFDEFFGKDTNLTYRVYDPSDTLDSRFCDPATRKPVFP